MKYLDDLLMVAGCALILFGTWKVSPLAVWFVAGGMCVLAGIVVAIGKTRLGGSDDGK